MLSHSFIVNTLKDTVFTLQGEDLIYAGVSIDSRKIKEGMLFVALKGTRVDGHDFINQAIDAGAKGVICQLDHHVRISDHIRFYRVLSSLSALRKIATAHRLRLSCPVIAIAGSVGKTTTKEFLAAMLRGKFNNVVATENSENGQVGVPLTILKAAANCDALVVEIGIDSPGSMQSHLEVVRPTAGIVTAITPEHLEGLGDMETVTNEESLCLRWVASHDGLVVLNLDDERLSTLESELPTLKNRVVTYQLLTSLRVSNASFRGSVKNSPFDFMNCLLIKSYNSSLFELTVPLPGTHNARNLLGAVAIAEGFGLRAEEMQEGLKTFLPPEGRSIIAKTREGATVLCDFYNASPASMEAAFQTAYELRAQTGGKLLAVLGDMLELGGDEETFHKDLASQIIELDFDCVFCFGTRMKWLGDALRKTSFAGISKSSTELTLFIDILRKILRSQDVLLIKGSRGMQMERVWNAIKA